MNFILLKLIICKIIYNSIFMILILLLMSSLLFGLYCRWKFITKLSGEFFFLNEIFFLNLFIKSLNYIFFLCIKTIFVSCVIELYIYIKKVVLVKICGFSNLYYFIRSFYDSKYVFISQIFRGGVRINLINMK